MGSSAWTTHGLELRLTPSRGRRWLGQIFASAALGCVAILGMWVASRARALPACETPASCELHLPDEVNPDPPERDGWVVDRVVEVLESVRLEDRLPIDVTVLEQLDSEAPGTLEWAFLSAEHQPIRMMAVDGEPGPLAAALQDALDSYRLESGRVHFQDSTRFVAEIAAVREAQDRLQTRRTLDSLADAGHSVLDLGTASGIGLASAATALAEGEWLVRRRLEARRLEQVRDDLAEISRRDSVAGAWAMAVWTVLALLSAVGLLLGIRGRIREADDVEIQIDSTGIRVDGTWIPAQAVDWVGVRGAALRVVTVEEEWTSRRVLDDRALHRVVKEWRRLSPVTAAADAAHDRLVRLTQSRRR